MAEFIVGYPLRKAARRHEMLRQFLWRVDFGLLWTLVALFRLLPVDWASAMGARVGAFVGPLMRHKNAILEDNLRTMFPQKSASEISELAKASWSAVGRVVSEYPHIDRIANEQAGERLQIDVSDPDTTFADRDRPAVVVAAHLGNWELAAAALGRLGIANVALYSPLSNPLLDRKLLDFRAALDSELIPRDNCARTLISRMSAGRTVGMLIDHPVDHIGKTVSFFGKDKFTTILPAKLALKFECDLIPAQVERINGAHFRVTFHPPIRASDPNAPEAERALDMVEQVNRLFENWIRQKPSDWYCAKRIWPKDRSKTQ